MTTKKAILIFGGAKLQQSLIKECKAKDLYTVVIDPNPLAEGKNFADKFEVIGPHDFVGTCKTIQKHNISAIITSATDKPLVMMARVAEKYNFPFFSIKTAIRSTDKFLMKKCFQRSKIPCAKGFLANNVEVYFKYPLIIKPRDNSGSRGVIYCNDFDEAKVAISEALAYSKKDTVLIEEFIEGKEFSIESLHFGGLTKVIQFTEKITTPFPYNVELGHIQPAELDAKTKTKIALIINKVAKALNFENCASHTEIKINKNGIFIIETSPRLGGDYITSVLTPLSTGVVMEQLLIDIATGISPKQILLKKNSSAIFYFNFGEGIVKSIKNYTNLKNIKGVFDLKIEIKKGSKLSPIKNSLDRYGYFIVYGASRAFVVNIYKRIISKINVTFE